MQLLLGDELMEFDNNGSGIEEMMKTIKEKAFASSDYLFSHLIIDGTAVYEDFAEYLHDNIESIQLIRVAFLTLKEFIEDLLLSTSSYLDRAIPAIEKLADVFYNHVDSEAWQQVNNLLEGIQWLSKTYESMDTIPDLASLVNEYEQWNLYVQALQELQEATINLEEPLRFADYVTASDILLYEIKPAMEKMNANVPSVK